MQPTNRRKPSVSAWKSWDTGLIHCPAQPVAPSESPATRARWKPICSSELPGVAEVIAVTKPYKLVSRDMKSEDTVVRFEGSDATVGGPELAMMAGPCSVESRDQLFRAAEAVAKAWRAIPSRRRIQAAHLALRLSRTWASRAWRSWPPLAKPSACWWSPKPSITNRCALVDQYADMIQIGARNMQNFALLKLAGRANKPVLLKRGIAATLDELLMAAEYVMSEGNYNVVLCERGIRTFTDHTRNTLDVSIIPAVKRLTHLPIIVDPSHAAGKRDKVVPLARAGVAVGADGLIVEMHRDPDHALSDGAQSLYPDQFAAMVRDLRKIAEIVGRTIAEPQLKGDPATSVVSK